MRATDGERLTYAIGDVHGRLDLLEELAARCLSDAGQRCCAAPQFVLLGDYIDRGRDSAGVVEFIRALGRRQKVVALRGNHDQMMVDTVLGQDDGRAWAANGMVSTATSYGYGWQAAPQLVADEKRALVAEALRADERAVDDARWLADLSLIHEDQHRIFIHAGLCPGAPVTEQVITDLLWLREPFLRHRGSFGKLVVHGHTPSRDDKPDVRANRVGLDTGAYASGILTAALFDLNSPGPIAIYQTGEHG